MEESLESLACSCCGETHSSVPLSFAADYPDIYANMTDEQRAEHADATLDQCIIDNGTWAIRGVIEIPIHERSDPFLLGVWSVLFEEDFDEIHESWREEGRETKRGPYKGRLANSLPIYSETLNLTLKVVIRPVGSRPLFYVTGEHLIATQQKNGISLEKARELASQLLHWR